MFSITGQVTNVFHTPGGKRKDGSSYDSETKMQIMGNTFLSNGEKKAELVTLTMPLSWVEPVKRCLGKELTFPCGIFVSGGVLRPFISESTPIPASLTSK
jgi:hypothetical protein